MIFRSLLLLKRGGEAVFFGELGEGSANLVAHFGAAAGAAIREGENPASWMLDVLNDAATDLALEYAVSDLAARNDRDLDAYLAAAAPLPDGTQVGGGPRDSRESPER